MSNIFEVATRNKVRFPFKGMISVEELWDLKVTELDSIFKALNSRLKVSNEDSLLNVKTEKDKTLDLQIAIIKHIVSVKLEEQKLAVKAKANKELKQKILSIKAEKNDEALKSKTPEELDKILESLS